MISVFSVLMEVSRVFQRTALIKKRRSRINELQIENDKLEERIKIWEKYWGPDGESYLGEQQRYKKLLAENIQLKERLEKAEGIIKILYSGRR